MKTHYIRREPERPENLTALLAGLGVATATFLATFYLTRLLLAREPLDGAGYDPKALPAPEEVDLLPPGQREEED